MANFIRGNKEFPVHGVATALEIDICLLTPKTFFLKKIK